jgi:hypothetical protein
MTEWLDIKSAPKNDNLEEWIQGVNSAGQQRVITWCTDYPCDDGVWKYASAPSEYIDNILEFYPTHWKPLDKGPK